MRRTPCVLAVAAFVFTALVAFAEESTVDEAVAVVNSDVITRSRVERRIAQLTGRAISEGYGQRDFELALQVEIERTLVLRAAEARFGEAALERIRTRARELLEGNRDPRAADPLATSKAAVEAYYSELVLQLYLRREIYDKVSVTPAEMRAYYGNHSGLYYEPAGVRVSQILIRQGPRTSDEAKALAEEAAARLRDGEDFADVASDVSEGPYASSGGLWPPHRRGELIGEVEKVALSLRTGRVSAPFHTALGWHVIRLEENSPGGAKSFADVQGAVYSALLAEKQGEVRRRLLADLKARAVITRSAPPLEAPKGNVPPQ